MINSIKKLVFHIYVYNDKDYLNNIAYKMHIKCLTNYSNIFDKACFNISIDEFVDENIIELIKIDLIKCGFKNIEIIVTNNNPYCEVNTFKYFILENIDNKNNELVFFGHTKGLMNVIDGVNYPENILHWIYTMYFFNLENLYIKDMENKLIYSYGGYKNTFYGTLRTFDYNENASYYSGTFYWVNTNKLYEDNLNVVIRIPKICNRNFCEDLPYVYRDKNNIYNGLASFYNKGIDNYLYNDNNWYDISYYLSNGNNEKYIELFNKIRSEI